MQSRDYYKQPMRPSLFKIICESKKIGSLMSSADMYVTTTHPLVIEHFGMDPVLLYKCGTRLIEELNKAASDIELDEDELYEVVFFLDLVGQTVSVLEEYLTQLLSS